MKLMKLTTTMLLLCFIFMACGQRDTDTQRCVQEKFNQMYPQATRLEWEKEKKYYTIDFEEDRIDKEAWFNSDCEWRMTESDVSYQNLPQPIQNAINSGNYSTWRVEDIDYIERSDRAPFYAVEIELGEKERILLFDADGNLLKDINERDESYKNPDKTPNF